MCFKKNNKDLIFEQTTSREFISEQTMEVMKHLDFSWLTFDPDEANARLRCHNVKHKTHGVHRRGQPSGWVSPQWLSRLCVSQSSWFLLVRFCDREMYVTAVE